MTNYNANNAHSFIVVKHSSADCNCYFFCCCCRYFDDCQSASYFKCCRSCADSRSELAGCSTAPFLVETEWMVTPASFPDQFLGRGAFGGGLLRRMLASSRSHSFLPLFCGGAETWRTLTPSSLRRNSCWSLRCRSFPRQRLILPPRLLGRLIVARTGSGTGRFLIPLDMLAVCSEQSSGFHACARTFPTCAGFAAFEFGRPPPSSRSAPARWC